MPPAPSSPGNTRPTGLHKPLLGWSFSGVLRDYQRQILDQLDPAKDRTLHIVAPPGAGKTLVGALLAAKDGGAALVLTPTLVIRDQWARTGTSLSTSVTAVSTDRNQIGDMTCLTYQMLSVVKQGPGFDELARVQWIDELCEGGQNPATAAQVLEDMELSNKRAYRSGIRSRARNLRRQFTRANPDRIAQILHPNVITLVDQLVDHGVSTIILDECHHLLDHWALVVAYVRARLGEAGRTPLIIGLTATLPSTEDGPEYDNYTALLGDVDYQIPTPAVTKEGNLAPSRSLAWFTAPTDEEKRFIRTHEKRLREMVFSEIRSDLGRTFLIEALGLKNAVKNSQEAVDTALAEDFAFTLAAARTFSAAFPQEAHQVLLDQVLMQPPSNEELLRVVSRFAITTLLKDRAHEKRWRHLKGVLADFGVSITDRGVRMNRDPVADVLAKSDSQYAGAVQILRQELAGPDRDRIRAVVVTDFVRHTNRRGRGDHAPDGGALRAFEVLANDSVTGAMRPVLITRNHLWVREADALMLSRRLTEMSGEQVVADSPAPAPGIVALSSELTPTALLDQVGELITQGAVCLLVITRGIAGEGWDCPAVNTLVDLTMAATSSASQQLRGRTLRLDPAWPTKVAHNWTVVCMSGRGLAASDSGEISRFIRKHDSVWGIDRDDGYGVVTGINAVLNETQRQQLVGIAGKTKADTIARLNQSISQSLGSRSEEYAAWRIGEPFAGATLESVRLPPVQPDEARSFISPPTAGTIIVGAALAVILPILSIFPRMFRENAAEPWWIAVLIAVVAICLIPGLPGFVRSIRGSARRTEFYSQGSHALMQTLISEGLVGTSTDTIPGRGNITAVPINDFTSRPAAIVVTLTAGTTSDRQLLADTVDELFGPVASPRFLLQVGQMHYKGDITFYGWCTRLMDAIWPARTYLPVPRIIGARRERAQNFAKNWQKHVGPAVLIELSSREDARMLAKIRRLHQGRHSSTAAPLQVGRSKHWA